MILLVYGEESFLLIEKILQIKRKFIETKDNFNIDEFDSLNFEYNEFINKITTPPFLEDKRLIILKNILLSSKKDLEEKITDSLKKIPTFSILLISEELEINDKNKKKKIDAIKKLSEKIWYFPKMTPMEIERWTEKRITNLKGEISKQALFKLISYTGNNLWQLNEEINKLTNYKNKQIISEQDIDMLVMSKINSSVFDLIDNIGEKNIEKSIKYLNNLIENGNDPIYLLGMIVYQFKNLMTVKNFSLSGKNKQEIISKSKIHPFVINKTLNQAKNFSEEELIKIYKDIFKIETEIKTGKKEPKIALNLLVTKLCLKQ